MSQYILPVPPPFHMPPVFLSVQVFPPFSCLRMTVLFFHIIFRMTIILSYGNDYDLRYVLTKIPFTHTAKPCIIMYFIPNSLHSYLLRFVIPALAIHKCDSSLSNVMYLCPLFSCQNPAIRIVTVWITTLMLRVFLSNKVNSLRYLSCWYRVSVHLYSFVSFLLAHSSLCVPYILSFHYLHLSTFFVLPFMKCTLCIFSNQILSRVHEIYFQSCPLIIHFNLNHSSV